MATYYFLEGISEDRKDVKEGKTVRNALDNVIDEFTSRKDIGGSLSLVVFEGQTSEDKLSQDQLKELEKEILSRAPPEMLGSDKSHKKRLYKGQVYGRIAFFDNFKLNKKQVEYLTRAVAKLNIGLIAIED